MTKEHDRDQKEFAEDLPLGKYFEEMRVWEPYKAKYGVTTVDLQGLLYGPLPEIDHDQAATVSRAEITEEDLDQPTGVEDLLALPGWEDLAEPLEAPVRGSMEHFIIAYVQDGFRRAKAAEDGGSMPGESPRLAIVAKPFKAELKGIIETRKGVEDGTQLANEFVRDLKNDLNQDIAAQLGRTFP